MTSRQVSLVAFIILFYLITHALMLTKYPHLSVDEPWVSAPTYHYIDTGVFKNPSHWRLGPEGFESRQQKIVEPFFVHQYSLYPVYYFFGTGLLQGRFWMAFLGLLVLLVSYKLAKYLFDREVAVLCLLLLVLDSLFFNKTRMIRPEPLGVLLSVSALYCYLLARDKRSVPYAAISGVLCGLCVFNHPMGAFVAIAMIFLEIRHYKTGFLKTKYLWIAGTCALGSFGLYFIGNDLSELLEYQHFIEHYSSVTIPPGNPFLRGIERELESLAGVYFPYRPASGLAVLLVVAVSVFIRKASTGRILAIIAAFLFWCFVFPPSHTSYYVYVSPFIAILIASIWDLEKKDVALAWLKKSTIKVLFFGVLAVYLGNHLAYAGAVMYRNKDYDYMRLKADFDKIPEEFNRVLSDFFFWFHLKEKDFVAINFLVLTEFELIDEFKPQVVIIGDKSLSWYKPEDRNRLLGKLRGYIEEKGGRLIDIIETPYYGPVKVFLLERNA